MFYFTWNWKRVVQRTKNEYNIWKCHSDYFVGESEERLFSRAYASQ